LISNRSPLDSRQAEKGPIRRAVRLRAVHCCLIFRPLFVLSLSHFLGSCGLRRYRRNSRPVWFQGLRREGKRGWFDYLSPTRSVFGRTQDPVEAPRRDRVMLRRRGIGQRLVRALLVVEALEGGKPLPCWRSE